MRLLSGILAGQNFVSTLTGDESLCSRPMQRIIEPLEAMGAQISAKDGRAPLTIYGSSDLKAIDYELLIASAQVKSSILLAGLHAEGKTTVIENEVTRDHTERMLDFFGVSIETGKAEREPENARLAAVRRGAAPAPGPRRPPRAGAIAGSRRFNSRRYFFSRIFYRGRGPAARIVFGN